MFQSAPGTSAGRYDLRGDISPDLRGVSIRARHECRAIPKVGTTEGSVYAVSIRARHECRAIPPSCQTRLPGAGFNPRPARVPGDTPIDQLACDVTLVSIRARHECRAIRTERQGFALTFGLFQSAPGTSAGRYIADRSCTPGAFSFQSAPGTSAGRYIISIIATSHQSCFNPRPARVPGDTFGGKAIDNEVYVSIRARHECRAIRAGYGDSRADSAVSIRARHECRAIHHGTDNERTPRKVSIRARHECRAILSLVSASLALEIVSIRARHECRAILLDVITQALNGVVSIRARHECRAIRRKSRSNRLAGQVSIRARHECRAIPGAAETTLEPLNVFQSAPGTSAGRYCWYCR